MDLYPWQRWLLIHALELDPALTTSTMDQRGRLDPIFRFRKVVVLVARQNGKSTLSQVLSLFFLYVLKTSLVLGTAQDLDTAEEVWDGALDIIEDTPELAELADRPVRVNGKKTIRLLNDPDLGVRGERYKVKAANRRAGRGLSGDLILLDELREHQSWDAWAAVTKTTQARPAAMIWALSNAGDASSLVLRYLRKAAHLAIGDPDGINADDDPMSLLPTVAQIEDLEDLTDGPTDDLEPEDFEEDIDTLGLFEWSAPPGCSVFDRDGWEQSNPSMGYGISERTIAGDAKGDPEWVFRTEVLCQWSDGSLEGPFPPGQWDRGVDAQSRIAEDSPVVYSVDVSADRTRSHISVAGWRDDQLPHIEVAASRAGVEWVVSRVKLADGTEQVTGWFADRASKANPMTVVVQAKGAPASALIDDLELIEGLTVIPIGGEDLGKSTERLYNLVKASGLIETDDGPPRRTGLCHLPQPVLDVAAATAVPKILTDGGMAWDRKRSPHDIAALVAATFALWQLTLAQPKSATSVYESRGVLTV